MTTPIATYRDTVNPENMTIDNTYQGVLAYADGKYAWSAAQERRFVDAGKHLWRITVLGNPRIAAIADCERYDLTPAGAANFARQRNALRDDATVYVDVDSVPALVGELDTTPCWLIVASWTPSVPHIPQLELPAWIKVAAVQYQNTPGWDNTAVYDRHWLGRWSY